MNTTTSPKWTRTTTVALLVALLAVAAVASVRAYTVNPSYAIGSQEGTCTVEGEVAINESQHGEAYTYLYAGSCGSFHVHAYFWGSDSVYHYLEDNSSVAALAIWRFWTDDIYGYHDQNGTAPYATTRAY